MNQKLPVQQGGDNLVVNRFPKDNSTESDIAVVDSRCCIRDAIAESLREKSKRRIYTADNPDALLDSAFCNTTPAQQTILFCDGSLPPERVEQDLHTLRKNNKNAKIALLTDHENTDSHSRLLDGVIPSQYETSQLLACLKVIETGIKYSPALSTDNGLDSNQNITPKFDENAIALLTPRQRQVMQFISEGRSNKYIAAELSVSESTIKVHVHEAMKRLGATSRTHASYILNNSE